MNYQYGKYLLKMVFICVLLIVCLILPAGVAEQDITIMGVNYVLSNESNYDYTGATPVNSFFYGSASLGSLQLNGIANKGMTDNGYVAYEASGSVSIRYAYNGSYQYKDPDKWYVDKDDTRWIRSYDMGFLNNIAHGCIMVEKSSNGKTWDKVIDPIRDYFNQAKSNSNSLIYTIPESEMRNGMLFRVVVAYRFARRTKDNLIFDEYDLRKCVEVYEFYITLSDTNKSVSIKTEAPTISTSAQNTPTSTPTPTKTKKAEVTPDNHNDTPQEKNEPKPISFYEATDLNGRGLVDVAGREPDYIGVIGFATVFTEANLETNAEFDKTSWTVPTYQKTTDGMKQTGKIEHKTKIGIISQELSKQNGREFQGYLEFQDLSTGKTGYINVKNFVTNQYWKEEVSVATERGYCVAQFRQKSKYIPVNKNGERITIKDATKILLPARGTYYISVMDRINYQILGIIFVKRNNKMEPQYVFFNKKDLTLTY